MSHKSGNISIFVIFVLLASSLLGLLTLILVQKLLRYQGVAIGYYQSYYSAKAGMETALALHTTRGIGFSYTVPGSLFTENLSCGSACDVQAELIGRSTFIQDDYWLHTQCTSGFVIEPGQSKAIPLFYDDGEAGVYQLFTDPVEYTSIYSSFTNINAAPVTRESGITIRMGMFALSGNALITDGSFIQDYNGSIMQMIPWFWNVYQAYAIGYPALQSPTVQHYLLLANPTESPIQLCVSTQGLYDPIQLGQEIASLRSVASYASYRVGLQAVLDSSIPQFLLQTYSEL